MQKKVRKYSPLDWPGYDITPKRGMYENDYIMKVMRIYV